MHTSDWVMAKCKWNEVFKVYKSAKMGRRQQICICIWGWLYNGCLFHCRTRLKWWQIVNMTETFSIQRNKSPGVIFPNAPYPKSYFNNRIFIHKYSSKGKSFYLFYNPFLLNTTHPFSNILFLFLWPTSVRVRFLSHLFWSLFPGQVFALPLSWYKLVSSVLACHNYIYIVNI